MMQAEQSRFLYYLCNVLLAFTGTLSASPRFGSLPKVVCKSMNVRSKNENTHCYRDTLKIVSVFVALLSKIVLKLLMSGQRLVCV